MKDRKRIPSWSHILNFCSCHYVFPSSLLFFRLGKRSKEERRRLQPPHDIRLLPQKKRKKKEAKKKKNRTQKGYNRHETKRVNAVGKRERKETNIRAYDQVENASCSVTDVEHESDRQHHMEQKRREEKGIHRKHQHSPTSSHISTPHIIARADMLPLLHVLHTIQPPYLFVYFPATRRKC